MFQLMKLHSRIPHLVVVTYEHASGSNKDARRIALLETPDHFAGNDYKRLQIVAFLQFQPVSILIAETLTYWFTYPSLPPVSEGSYTYRYWHSV